MKESYSDRGWLESPGSYSTGTISAYAGPVIWKDSDTQEVKSKDEVVLRIADCRGSVFIHPVNNDMVEYIAKLRFIADVCDRFANFLEKKELT